jgi:hypothetical protein
MKITDKEIVELLRHRAKLQVLKCNLLVLSWTNRKEIRMVYQLMFGVGTAVADEKTSASVGKV